MTESRIPGLDDGTNAAATSTTAAAAEGRLPESTYAELREIAARDAERIKADRELGLHGDAAVPALSKDAAREVVSAEAKALGHRPPKGSLAAEAQSAGDRHPEGGSFNPGKNPVEMEVLKEKAREEGARLREQEVGSDGKGVVNGAS